ncbi:MAG: SPOR domain-containing protein [Bacteroidota bacterium]
MMIVFSNLNRYIQVSTKLIVILSLYIPFISYSSARPDDDIRTYINKLNNGKVEEVKQVLPQLITQYQDTPELIYLQGRLTSNGPEAAKYYQMVLDNFPQSEWADKSLYHLYQYHYATGSYETARNELSRLKKDYPSSTMLAEAGNIPIPVERIETDKKVDTRSSSQHPYSDNATRTSSANPDFMNGETGHSTLSGKYALQVGAFSTAANAAKQKTFFDKLGYTVEITSKVMFNKGLYCVWVGAYKSSQDARHDGDKIRKKYKISSMVIVR